MKRFSGFTIIELMIVVAIIALLSIIAIPNFFSFLGKAKRAEAYMNLGSIYTAQKAYWIEHGHYSNDLSKIGWKPEGYAGGGKEERFYYTYGFPGIEGKNYFTGKLEASAEHLQRAQVDKFGFVVVAAGDISGNGVIDILTVDQHNAIKIVQDSLK
jgi:prepilin-type N-terminal cleavage/methylation domain-containing protein